MLVEFQGGCLLSTIWAVWFPWTLGDFRLFYLTTFISLHLKVGTCNDIRIPSRVLDACQYCRIGTSERWRLLLVSASRSSFISKMEDIYIFFYALYRRATWRMQIMRWLFQILITPFHILHTLIGKCLMSRTGFDRKTASLSKRSQYSGWHNLKKFVL